MTRLEVVTWDYGTGLTVVDHVFKVAHHNGKRKFKKLMKRAERWARKAAQQDHSTDHAVYVRSV